MTRQRISNIGIPSAFALFLAVLTVLTVFAGSATAQNPVPFIDQPLVPDATAPGGAGFTLTVNGAGFVATSVVHWNGSPRATTFLSSSKLTAAILASDIVTASTVSVAVVNPSPGGGVSNTQFFLIAVAEASVSFLPVVTYDSGGTLAWYLAVEDVNGDGIPDVVVVNYGSSNYSSVGVLLGNGDGTLRPAVTYGSGGSYASGMAIADLNGDGKPDLVVANLGCPGIVSNCLGVLLGNGNGTFQPG